MKYIISETQYNRISNILNESTISSSDIQTLESVLNRKLPKKFPFFKKVDLDSIGTRVGGVNTLNFYGTFYLDFNWIFDYWTKFFHDKGNLIEPSKLDEILSNLYYINELIGEDDLKRFYEEIMRYYNFVTAGSVKYYNFDDMKFELVKDESKKMEQMESELTEKCWAGYTQKGMKTMFGKRYPNCVKKTKK